MNFVEEIFAGCVPTTAFNMSIKMIAKLWKNLLFWFSLD